MIRTRPRRCYACGSPIGAATAPISPRQGGITVTQVSAECPRGHPNPVGFDVV